jgi:hypothetical protein
MGAVTRRAQLGCMRTQVFPVQTSLRLPLALRDDLIRQAERNGRSFSGQIRFLLQTAAELRERQISAEVERLASLAVDPVDLVWR